MQNNTIKLTDKDLITYLSARGFEIIASDKDSSKNRSVVTFKNTEELDKAILDYVNRVGDVNISDYLAAEKRIKNLLYFNKTKEIN
ncbi:hypothetical protein CACET_c15900 [Clostridium aceticum]|uniref:Uncharacterized protein n=1 Tax=Clostridium aceticum TaxID=84022 RepID=A0A0D8ICA2_9CLOT|nr:DUF5659 domain-containing protein [Clostridium aceticum]AKL95039.1 hypothetical protein CACET_c15900 [Clostridium aceticum]KJF27930.1 hypothetical protein TZ02_05000 [Clostridium aceticum]